MTATMAMGAILGTGSPPISIANAPPAATAATFAATFAAPT